MHRVDRRTLCLIAGAFGTSGVTGCVGSLIPQDSGTSIASPENDQWPVTTDGAERGQANTVVTAREPNPKPNLVYMDGSRSCAESLSDAVFRHLDAELEDTTGIGFAFPAGNENLDGTAIIVVLQTKRNREGEVIEEPSVALSDVIEVTPPRAVLLEADGEPMCTVPVYVKEETHTLD